MHEASQHESACAHPKSNDDVNLAQSTTQLTIIPTIPESGADVMAALMDREAKYVEEKKLFGCLVDLLSYEKITFNGEFHFLNR